MSRRLRVCAAAAFVITCLAVGGSAVAQSTTVSIRAVREFAASDYWTDARVQSARPQPFYRAPTEVAPELMPFGPPESTAGGRGGAFAAGDDAAEVAAAIAADASLAAALAAELDEGVPFGTPNIYDSDYVNRSTLLWRQYPYRTIGKLLFTNANGSSSYCSASVISPNNIIVTAAHCCHNRTSFHRNWAFVPAMRDIARPYGTFPWRSARILTGWITSGTRNFDVCVLTMGPNASGQGLSNLVGWLGRSWNFPNIQHHFAFGYPSNISGGAFKYEASAESYANCGNGLVNAMGSPMTFGSSGGPWIRVFKRFTAGAANFVNTVVSGWDACTGAFGGSFNGARFTSNNIVPLCTAQGC